ncbi:tetratricopeptide repeat protein [Streptomyces sp. NPDC048277]|uniref:ATP-binding protein n=1 Tax=Streptomyces sp. NPDC048277 TaxID=3155027 RepID=UPI0033D0C81B
MPAPPTAFTGRDRQVAQLTKALDPNAAGISEAAPIVAVGGLGGMGKTALALHVAHAVKSWFPGGTLFVNMRGYDEASVAPEQAALSLLRALGVRDGDMLIDSDELYIWYRSQLNRHGPVLIILDNVSDPSQVVPLLPGDSRHRVLVTSRESLDSPPALQINLGSLHPDEAVTLVERSLRLKNPHDSRVAEEPDAVRKLVELCGCMPLALQIVAAQLRRRRSRSISTVVTDLQAATDRVTELHFQGMDQYERTLALRPVFDMTYARLDTEQAKFFRQIAQSPGVDFCVATACALSALSSAEALDQLDELAASFLITPSGSGERWSMHDLIRNYAHVLIAERPGHLAEATDARNGLIDSLLRLAMGADKHLHGLLMPEAPDLFTSHTEALAWLDIERSTLVGAALWANESEHSDHASMLGICIHQYLRLGRYHTDAEAVAKAALSAAQANGDRNLEASAWSTLGNVFQDLRRHTDAAKAHTKGLRLSYSLGDRTGQAISWTNIASSMDELDQFAIAFQMRQFALTIFSQLSDEHRAAMVWNDLGTSLRLLGRLKDAVRAHRTARRIHARLGDRRREAIAWLRLGLVLKDLGDLDAAANAYMNAADIFRDLGDRHGEANAWNNTGQVLVEVRSFDMALQSFGACAAAYSKLEAWYEAGIARRNIALLYDSHGQNEEALKAWRWAADAFTRADAQEESAEALDRMK